MLMRFDPFRELDRLTQATWGQNRPTMAMDAYRRNGDFVVNFDLPGVDPNTIDLTVEKNVLTVTAERGFSRSESDEVVVAERPQGRFSRQLFLGESLDAEHIQANYEHGVLTLHIPVAEKAKPRKVEVTTGGEPAVEVVSSAS
ncbi:MAG: Hsp20/alpha crystallin family protein [Actinomycetota bacterium]|nr:Hsp20/alpha crystallin family protein [Actinomycetota bacterium]